MAPIFFVVSLTVITILNSFSSSPKFGPSILVKRNSSSRSIGRYMWLTSRHLEGGTAEIRFVMGSGRVWII